MDTNFNFCLPLPALSAQAGFYSPKKAELPPSRKLTRYELIFVRAGGLHIETSGAQISVPTGKTVILSPGWVHGAEQSDGSYYWIQFDQPPKIGEGTIMRIAKVSTPQRPERLATLFHSFIEAQEEGWVDTAEQSLALFTILREAAYALDPLVKPSALRLAGRVLAYIRQHALEGLATSVLAAELDVDPDHMGRVFKRVYGQTITEAIHEQQLRVARGLLRESARRIGEISRLCGFEDPGYFRRVFDARHGMSPRTYRRLYKRTDLDED